MTTITQTKLVSTFRCLCEACEDTCCQNWSMQVDDATLTKYQNEAPELLNSVDKESDGIPVMKRDPVTRFCVKMDNGWCGIHKQYGDRMLGDACHFYPRATRNIGAETIMTATPSCPEIVRLMLSLDAPFEPVFAEVERLPHQIKNYLPENTPEAVAKAVHAAFLQCALDETTPPEQALARISSVARSMNLLDPKTLDQSIPLYLRLADGRIAKKEENPADVFNLLHALCGLIVASQKPISERLKKTLSDMERALDATLDWQHVQIALSPESASLLAEVKASWEAAKDKYAHVLRRFLGLQISLHYFPYAGLGATPEERITFIGLRFATLKWALACAHHLHGPLPESEIVRIVQSLSRFLDHLGDAAFSLSIFNETGWVKEARLLALVS